MRPACSAASVLASVIFLLVLSLDSFAASGPIYDGPQLDYQPAIIRSQPSGDLMVVFERLSGASMSGDLYVVFSTDNGQTWTSPQVIINSGLNERAPTLVQLANGSYLLFYLVDTTGSNQFRIYRATSSNGTAWTVHGALDLGWAGTGEINPSVILESDGSLTLAYQRLSSPCYLARSLDNGVTWDALKTQVSNSTAALPRIVKRDSDGRYLLTYQTGSSSVDIWTKTTLDPYLWPGTATAFSTAINSHDPQPIVLEGGTFLVAYAQQVASVFDLYYKTGFNGMDWSAKARITNNTTRYDTQPHPLLHGTAGRILLTWPHQESSSPYVDHDLWIERDLEIPLPLWLDRDTISVTGGTVNLTLDAGAANGNRVYLVLGTMGGTEPGVSLPGGLATLPLNWDSFTDFVLNRLNTPVFTDFLGGLDGAGRASASINAPAVNPAKIGTVMHYAFLLDEPFEFVSNPVSVTFVP